MVVPIIKANIPDMRPFDTMIHRPMILWRVETPSVIEPVGDLFLVTTILDTNTHSLKWVEKKVNLVISDGLGLNRTGNCTRGYLDDVVGEDRRVDNSSCFHLLLSRRWCQLSLELWDADDGRTLLSRSLILIVSIQWVLKQVHPLEKADRCSSYLTCHTLKYLSETI